MGDIGIDRIELIDFEDVNWIEPDQDKSPVVQCHVHSDDRSLDSILQINREFFDLPNNYH
jgi:hypothetical protein